jgi:hypothetical protein
LRHVVDLLPYDALPYDAQRLRPARHRTEIRIGGRRHASDGTVRPYLSAVIRLRQNVTDPHAGVAALYHQTHPTR